MADVAPGRLEQRTGARLGRCHRCGEPCGRDRGDVRARADERPFEALLRLAEPPTSAGVTTPSIRTSASTSCNCGSHRSDGWGPIGAATGVPTGRWPATPVRCLDRRSPEAAAGAAWRRARSSDRTSLRTVPALAESPRASTSSGCCWRTDEACSRASTLRSVSHRSPPRCTRSARLSGSSTTATSSALITSGSAATVSASSWRRPTLSEQLGASGQARVGRKRTRHPRPTRLRGRGRPSPQKAGTSGTASVSHTGHLLAGCSRKG